MNAAVAPECFAIDCRPCAATTGWQISAGPSGTPCQADEIAAGVIRTSLCRPDRLPKGLVYNQLLVLGDEPILIHAGMRTIYPQVLRAARSATDVRDLRWISGRRASQPDEFVADLGYQDDRDIEPTLRQRAAVRESSRPLPHSGGA